MKPPYHITPEILNLIAQVSERIGAVQTAELDRLTPQLRKRNQIKTIYNTLAIEGNALDQEQVTAIIEGKRVLGAEKDILEVKNAVDVYARMHTLNPSSPDDFLRAHKGLMAQLLPAPGRYRTSGVGISKGDEIQHFAPPHERVPYLMKDLFGYLKSSEDHPLIRSAVFHYELEFIHPFLDGNGRMGRLWHQLILANAYPVFQYLSLESLIRERQSEYYGALSDSDKSGHSTPMILFSLQIIAQALGELDQAKRSHLSSSDRLSYFLQNTSQLNFTRKDYMGCFRSISTATASRDLKQGVEDGLFDKIGTKNQSSYRRKKLP